MRDSVKRKVTKKVVCFMLFLVFTYGSAALAEVDRSWLQSDTIAPEKVTNALNAVSSTPESEAAKEAEAYRIDRANSSGDQKHAAGLVMGAAFEKAGDTTGAKAAYAAVADEARETPYGNSASFRLRALEDSNRSYEDKVALYKKIGNEPATDGWFLVSEQWEWSDSRRGALKALVHLRSNQLSFRLFKFLHSRSTFPTPYAYLFVLLALGLGVKILALPLHAKAAKVLVQLRRLRPEILNIQGAYTGDPAGLQQRLLELYKERGVNVYGGCAVALLDVIFVIWALYALRDFAPQMALDEAKFFWHPNVLEPNLGVMFVWVGAVFLQALLSSAVQRTNVGILACSSLISGAIFVGIAWYFAWPAYVMIFWGLLSILGTALTLLLTPIVAAATR